MEIFHFDSSIAIISFCPTWCPAHTFHVAMRISDFGVINLIFRPVVHFSPAPWLPSAGASAAPYAVELVWVQARSGLLAKKLNL